MWFWFAVLCWQGHCASTQASLSRCLQFGVCAEMPVEQTAFSSFFKPSWVLYTLWTCIHCQRQALQAFLTDCVVSTSEGEKEKQFWLSPLISFYDDRRSQWSSLTFSGSQFMSCGTRLCLRSVVYRRPYCTHTACCTAALPTQCAPLSESTGRRCKALFLSPHCSMDLPLDSTMLIGTVSKFHNGDSKSSYIPVSKSFPDYSASSALPCKFSDKFILS